MFTTLMWTGIGLLAVGVVCLLAANRRDLIPVQQRRLRTAAVVIDVAAAGVFIVAAFL